MADGAHEERLRTQEVHRARRAARGDRLRVLGWQALLLALLLGSWAWASGRVLEEYYQSPEHQSDSECFFPGILYFELGFAAEDDKQAEYFRRAKYWLERSRTLSNEDWDAIDDRLFAASMTSGTTPGETINSAPARMALRAPSASITVPAPMRMRSPPVRRASLLMTSIAFGTVSVISAIGSFT